MTGLAMGPSSRSAPQACGTSRSHTAPSVKPLLILPSNAVAASISHAIVLAQGWKSVEHPGWVRIDHPKGTLPLAVAWPACCMWQTP